MKAQISEFPKREMKLIYIAGQYRGISDERVDLNIAAAKHAGALIAEKGHYPVIPHANTGQFERLVDQDEQFYLVGTLELMRRCDGVLLIQGWFNSEGARNEARVAEEMGMPVSENVGDLMRKIDNNE